MKRPLAMLVLCVAMAPGGCASQRALHPLDDLPHYLAEHKTLKNVVLYHFWSSTSEACLASLNQVGDLHERYADRGLVVLSVNIDPASGGGERAAAVLKRHDLAYPTFTDPDATYLRRFAPEISSLAVVRSLGVLLRDDLVVARGSLCRPGAVEVLERALARILPR